MADYRSIGEKLAEEGQMEEAMVQFRKHVERSPEGSGQALAEVYEMLSQCALELGDRPQEAIECAASAAAAAPEWAEGYLTLARVHLDAGNFRKAVTNFERVLQRCPDHPEVAEDLAFARARSRARADRPALTMQAVRHRRQLGCLWTVVDGMVYDLQGVAALHPGGKLIMRAVGEEASRLVRSQHARMGPVLRALDQHATCLGRLDGLQPDPHKEDDVLHRLKQRILRDDPNAFTYPSAGLPVAELVAVVMLLLFVLWARLAYSGAWPLLNVGLAWFWSRQLDSGLHAAAHGDFRRWQLVQRSLLFIYGLLTHHMDGYYAGAGRPGLPAHYVHHLHTNTSLDPDWTGFLSGGWLRRHSRTPWQPHHRYQAWTWLVVRLLFEPVRDGLSMLVLLLTRTVSLFDPPGTLPASPQEPHEYLARFRLLGQLWLEALLNPSYQGGMFLVCPWPQAVCVWMLSRVLAKLVLWPLAEVQHFMPEHPHLATSSSASDEQMDWATAQLTTTANLRLENPVIRAMDFLMFYGDTYQIEHHLFPTLSFTCLPAMADRVKAAAKTLELPYHELTYTQGFSRILQQLHQHRNPD